MAMGSRRDDERSVTVSHWEMRNSPSCGSRDRLQPVLIAGGLEAGDETGRDACCAARSVTPSVPRPHTRSWVRAAEHAVRARGRARALLPPLCRPHPITTDEHDVCAPIHRRPRPAAGRRRSIWWRSAGAPLGRRWRHVETRDAVRSPDRRVPQLGMAAMICPRARPRRVSDAECNVIPLPTLTFVAWGRVFHATL
jgi:hypothetical protein